MDESNLMEFNSPSVQANLNPTSINVSNVSPGNNPFDSLLKCAEDLCNPPKLYSTFQPSSSVTDDFFKLSDRQYCGRESVGCLWDDFSPRESLGILKLDSLSYSFNNNDNLNVPTVGTSQFSILEEQKSQDISNGPLNTAFLHPFSYCQRKQSILSSNSSISTNPSSLFNSCSLEGSEPSKIYSLNSTRNYDPNLNSKSEDNFNNAFLLTNIINSTSYSEIYIKDHNENRERLLSLPEMRIEDISIQTNLNKANDLRYTNDLKCEESLNNEYDIKYVPFKNVSNESCTEVVKNTDETFNDSVFIEANHLASKIADRLTSVGESLEDNFLDSTSPPSFDELEDSDTCDLKIDTETVFKVIDKMLPAQQNSNIVNVNENCSNDIPTYSKNACVDDVCYVMVSKPSLRQDLNNSTSNRIDYQESDKNICNSHSKNKSEICSNNGSSSSSVKSKDANELLHDLSEIINTEYTDNQKKKGQQLLSSLADILSSNNSNILSNKYDNLEDSGHSSIENDEHPNEQDLHTCYEVLDLRVVASKSNENEQVLDLSMTSKVENTNKRLSQSFSFPRPVFPPSKLINILKPHTSLKSSTSSLESSQGDASKLKPKKCEEKSIATKKGPLKAVIPLGNMSRLKSVSKMHATSSTPPKAEQPKSSLFKVKKTSTPTGEPKLKPLAQSTPDASKPILDRSRPISCSSQLKKRKFYCPVSPLARTSSIGSSSTNVDLNKSNHSGSAPNLSGNLTKSTRENTSIPSPKTMYRRHSATELKTSESNALKMRRSYSIGKDLITPTSVLSKMKKNVSAALSNTRRNSIGSAKDVSTKQKNSVLLERNSGITSNTKSLSLLGRLKKNTIGKENSGN